MQDLSHRPLSLALLLSGQLRTFVHDAVLRSFCRNAIDALCEDRSCSTVELILCAGSGQCGSSAQQNGQPTDVSTAEYRRTVAALRHCAQTSVVVVTPLEETTCDASISCGAEQKRWCTGPRRRCDEQSAVHPALSAWNASLFERSRGRLAYKARIDEARLALVRAGHPLSLHKSQLGILRWYRCLGRLETRERAREGGAFDWVVVARFDLSYFAPLPPLRAFAAHGRGVHLPANHLSPLNDFFALMPRVHADAYLSSACQACCNACWLRSPPLPWDARTLRRGGGGALDVILNGPEQWLGAQLHVHAVPVFAGYLPLALTRWSGGRSHPPGRGVQPGGREVRRESAIEGECHRHRNCNTSSLGYTQTATRDLRPNAEPDWPACPPDRVQACEAFFRPRGGGAAPRGRSGSLLRSLPWRWLPASLVGRDAPETGSVERRATL